MPAENIRAYQPGANSPEVPVFVVGIGPGNPGYLHSRARSIIDDADVLVGFETVLDCIGPPSGPDILPCTYETEASQLAAFADRVGNGETGAAVLMGDPNVSGYTFVEKVEEAVDRTVHIVPGISSVQVAASRARTPLESSTIITLHKRGDLDQEFNRLVGEAGSRHLLILPRPYDYMPERIAGELVDRGVEGSLDAIVYERLTLEDETVTQTTVADLASRDPVDESAFSDLSVLVVRGRG